MQRLKRDPRSNWQAEVENLGFGFHSGDISYWDESACYTFTESEINEIEKATAEVYRLCLAAVEHIITNKRYEQFQIPAGCISLIEKSWNNDEPSIYGRFDFSINKGQIKLLEFNADTPTGLFEAGIVQWFWLQDVDKQQDQFNSIHEKLIAYWKYLVPYLNEGILHFTCLKDSLEDLTTTEYLRDCAIQAGIKTKLIFIDEIGWDETQKKLIDAEDVPITNIFKLYPWEWLATDEFFNHITEDLNCFWIEPAWKMLLSNKAILPILYELFPESPYILPALFNDEGNMKSYVKKPLLSREGANIQLVKHYGTIEKSEGMYGKEGFIFQQLFELPDFDGQHPVVGSWVIGGEPAGIGIRESAQLITDNTSRFIPHYITA